MSSGFDLDFGYGREGEILVEQLLTNGKKVEVKRDRKWRNTNNIYIETHCWYVKTQSWELSGLLVTEAEYWAFVLEQGVILVPTHSIREAIMANGTRITCEIEPNRSRGYLIQVEDLLTALKN